MRRLCAAQEISPSDGKRDRAACGSCFYAPDAPVFRVRCRAIFSRMRRAMVR